ncbi:MAG: hypothetical protein IJK99_09330 [Bacteroidales bacterium]|nr:hypothetical protein [Bacteroidales bacterium]
MIDNLDVLKRELVSLLRPSADAFTRLTLSRSATERIDGYVTLLRQAIASSSLCYIDNSMAFFDGRAYTRLAPRSLTLIVANILPEFGVGASDTKKIGDMPFSVIFEKSYHNDQTKVCFSNCVYDIQRNRAYAFDRKHITDYALPYEWKADATCPRWEQFLAEVLPDPAERSCLQEFFGMCYIDRERLSIEKMALLIGEGSNGKSVIFDVMKNVIGKDWVSFLSPDQLIDNKQLVSVDGKKLNFSPDIKRSAAFDSGLKALSSSQDVQGWRLYAGNVIVKCPPLVFAFNERPRFRDDTDAFFRRLMPFQFDVVIPPERQNKKLASEICDTELPGIFRWIMDGRRRLLKHDGTFTRCIRMEKAVAAMKREVRKYKASPLVAFLESIGYDVKPQYSGQEPERVSSGRIFNGLGGSMTKDAITRELTSYHVAKDRGVEVRYFLYRIEAIE